MDASDRIERDYIVTDSRGRVQRVLSRVTVEEAREEFGGMIPHKGITLYLIAVPTVGVGPFTYLHDK